MTLKAAIPDIMKILVIVNVQKLPPEEGSVTVKKGFLEISQNSQENICVPVCIGTGVFLSIFAKFLRTPFLQNTPRRLLLNITSFKAFDCVSDLKIPFLVKTKIKLGQMNW